MPGIYELIIAFSFNEFKSVNQFSSAPLVLRHLTKVNRCLHKNTNVIQNSEIYKTFTRVYDTNKTYTIYVLTNLQLNSMYVQYTVTKVFALRIICLEVYVKSTHSHLIWT